MLALWEDTRTMDGAGLNALLVAHRGVIRAVMHELTGMLEPRLELGSIHILEAEAADADLRVAWWRPIALDLTGHLASPACP
jgi:broad specificity phosphatase PhoE